MWTLAVKRNQDLLGKTMLVLRRPRIEVVDLGRGPRPRAATAAAGTLRDMADTIRAALGDG